MTLNGTRSSVILHFHSIKKPMHSPYEVRNDVSVNMVDANFAKRAVNKINGYSRNGSGPLV
jgi:hypothetical protein